MLAGAHEHDTAPLVAPLHARRNSCDRTRLRAFDADLNVLARLSSISLPFWSL